MKISLITKYFKHLWFGSMARVPNYCHYLLHHLHVQYLSIMFSIFIIALALWMYDHVFIVQKLLLYFEGGLTHLTKTNTT